MLGFASFDDPIPQITSLRDYPITRFPDGCFILIVRLTPLFSRRRRVAQRLERLLDTQEVGGSSPPVPTIRFALSEPHDARRAEGPPSCSSMSQITITLPDGSSRVLPAGARVRDVAEGISRGWPRRHSPASSTDGWSICPFRSRRTPPSGL